MNFLRKIFSDSIIYGVSSYLSLIAAIFLTPIYTRILTKEDYGAMDIVNTWIGLLVAILPLGLMNAVVRFYPDIKDNPTKRKKYLSAILVVILANSVVLLLFALPFYRQLTNTFIGNDDYSHVVLLGLIVVFLTPIYSYQLQLLRVKMKQWTFLLISLVNFIVLAGLGFILVYWYHFGIDGFFYASITGLIISTLIGFIANKEPFALSFDKVIVMELLSYSIHFLSVFLLVQLTLVLDRYLINSYFSLEQNGIYSIANRIGSIVNIAVGAFAMAWLPYVFNIYKKPSAKHVFRKMYELYLFVSLILVLGILVFRPELIFFFAPSYAGAMESAGILTIYHIVIGLANVLSLGIHISKKTKILSYSAIITVIVNVVFSILLIRYMGIEGIAYGSLISAIVWIALQYYYSEKELKLKPNLMPLFAALALFAVTFLLGNYFGTEVSLSVFIIKIILFLVFSSLVIYFILKRFRSFRVGLSLD